MDVCNHAKVGVTLLALQGKRSIVHTTCLSVFLSALLVAQHSDSDLTASATHFSAILVLANGRLRMVISPLVDPLMFAPSEAKSPVQSDWAFCLPCYRAQPKFCQTLIDKPRQSRLRVGASIRFIN